MDKTITFFCLLLLFSCKQEEKVNCPKEDIVYGINPVYEPWAAQFPVSGTGYLKIKSDKGQQESLRIDRDPSFHEWYLADKGDCYALKGEWRDYNLYSTLYSKQLQFEIMQYARFETLVVIVNRSGGLEEAGVIFSEYGTRILYKPCDTCVNVLSNVTINNKAYAEAIRVYCPKGAGAGGKESIREIYIGKGSGIVQFTCSDSTVWNIE
jgi:hypothetical protein